MARIWLAVALVAGCSHEGAAPAKPGPPAPSTCDQVADHLISIMSAKSVAPPEQLDPFRRVIAHRCTEDLWTAKAQQCLLDAKTLDDGDRCKDQLTARQQDLLVRDGQAADTSLEGQGAPPPPPDGEATKGAPGPPALQPSSTVKPGASTGAGTGHRNGDPCEGGE
jgi:hypothetical protein